MIPIFFIGFVNNQNVPPLTQTQSCEFQAPKGASSSDFGIFSTLSHSVWDTMTFYFRMCLLRLCALWVKIYRAYKLTSTTLIWGYMLRDILIRQEFEGIELLYVKVNNFVIAKDFSFHIWSPIRSVSISNALHKVHGSYMLQPIMEGANKHEYKFMRCPHVEAE